MGKEVSGPQIEEVEKILMADRCDGRDTSTNETDPNDDGPPIPGPMRK